MIEETFSAEVVANDDPEKRGRIRVKCTGILGDEESDLPMWIEPCLDWGFFLVPDVGEIVQIVAVTCGEQDEIFGQASIGELDPKWYGQRFYQKDDDPSKGRRKVPDDFTSKNYGKRRGFKTPAGHLLIFDDTAGAEEVTLSCSSGKDPTRKQAFVSMDAKGSIVLSNTKGSTIYMNANEGQLSIIDQHGNTYASDTNGLKLISKHGYFIEMKDGAVQIVAGGNVVVQANNASIKAATVDVVDGADSFMIRGTEFSTWASTHTHPDAMGGTGPPVQPIPANAISTQAKVK